MSREHLIDQVVGLAKLAGWRVMHQRPARTAEGWRTTIIGDRGFPDLVLAKTSHTLFLEAKGPGAYPTVHQLEWLRALGPTAAVVRPEDWDWIHHLLTKNCPCIAEPTLRYGGGEWHGKLAGWAARRLAA